MGATYNDQGQKMYKGFCRLSLQNVTTGSKSIDAYSV